MMKTHRALSASVVVIGLVGVSVAASGQLVSGFGRGEAYRSNNQWQANNTPLLNSPSDDTGVVRADSPGSTGMGRARTALFSGGLGASAAGDAHGQWTQLPGGATGIMSHQSNGAGSVTYRDRLTVTSATLPAGTPVQVRFAGAVSFLISATHSAGGSGNWSSASGGMNFNVFDLYPHTGFTRWDTIILSAGGANNATGIWATGYFEQTITAAVGVSMQTLIYLTVDVTLGAGTTPGFLSPTTGSAWLGAGVSFGASSLTEGAAIRSQYLAGAFPGADQVSVAAASAFAPALPIPGVASAATVLAGVAGSGLRRRRPRGFGSPAH